MEEKSSGKLTSLMVFYNDTINSKFAKLQIVFFFALSFLSDHFKSLHWYIE